MKSERDNRLRIIKSHRKSLQKRARKLYRAIKELERLGVITKR